MLNAKRIIRKTPNEIKKIIYHYISREIHGKGNQCNQGTKQEGRGR